MWRATFFAVNPFGCIFLLLRGWDLGRGAIEIDTRLAMRDRVEVVPAPYPGPQKPSEPLCAQKIAGLLEDLLVDANGERSARHAKSLREAFAEQRLGPVKRFAVPLSPLLLGK
jgi:hypothetical protein